MAQERDHDLLLGYWNEVCRLRGLYQGVSKGDSCPVFAGLHSSRSQGGIGGLMTPIQTIAILATISGLLTGYVYWDLIRQRVRFEKRVRWAIEGGKR